MKGRPSLGTCRHLRGGGTQGRRPVAFCRFRGLTSFSRTDLGSEFGPGSDLGRTGLRPRSDHGRTSVGLGSDLDRTRVGLRSDWAQTSIGLGSDFGRTGLRPPIGGEFRSQPVVPRVEAGVPVDISARTHSEEPVEPVLELFQFVRAFDRARMSCVLRFEGDAFGWDVRFFECNVFVFGRGAFPTRALAVQWAVAERQAMEEMPISTRARWPPRRAVP